MIDNDWNIFIMYTLRKCKERRNYFLKFYFWSWFIYFISLGSRKGKFTTEQPRGAIVIFESTHSTRISFCLLEDLVLTRDLTSEDSFAYRICAWNVLSAERRAACFPKKHHQSNSRLLRDMLIQITRKPREDSIYRSRQTSEERGIRIRRVRKIRSYAFCSFVDISHYI